MVATRVYTCDKTAENCTPHTQMHACRNRHTPNKACSRVRSYNVHFLVSTLCPSYRRFYLRETWGEGTWGFSILLLQFPVYL